MKIFAAFICLVLAATASPQSQRAYPLGLEIIGAQHHHGIVGYAGSVHGNLADIPGHTVHAVDFGFQCLFDFSPKNGLVYRARWEPDGRLGILTASKDGARHECVVKAHEHKDVFYVAAPNGTLHTRLIH